VAITDIGSYVITGNEFEAHWTSVDADRVANSLAAFVLPDGFALADLTSAVAAVAAAITSQESLDNAFSTASNGRDAQKLALRDRVIEFRKIVDYRLDGSVYATSLPDTPAPGASEQKFLRALDDMAGGWHWLCQCFVGAGKVLDCSNARVPIKPPSRPDRYTAYRMCCTAVLDQPIM